MITIFEHASHDATKMPYEKDTFDLVLCMLVLHEMDHSIRMSVLAEMKQVLKADGYILLIDFHSGPARSLQERFTKSVIHLIELAAGRRHFRNYHQFITIRGLAGLIDENRFVKKQSKVVAGGALELCLIQAQ